MKKLIDEKGVHWISTEGEDIKEALEDAITYNRGYFKNKYYAIILNNTPCFAWINSKGYLHFIVNKKHYSYNKKNELQHIDTLLKWDYAKVVDQAIEDNAFLVGNIVFNGFEAIEA